MSERFNHGVSVPIPFTDDHCIHALAPVVRVINSVISSLRIESNPIFHLEMDQEYNGMIMHMNHIYVCDDNTDSYLGMMQKNVLAALKLGCIALRIHPDKITAFEKRFIKSYEQARQTLRNTCNASALVINNTLVAATLSELLTSHSPKKEMTNKRERKEGAESEDYEPESSSSSSESDEEADDESSIPATAEPKKKKKRSSKGRGRRNDKGELYFSLGKKRRLTASKYKDNVLIGIRQYWKNDKTGEMLPGKQGISLTVVQWKKLASRIEEINKEIDDLQKQ